MTAHHPSHIHRRATDRPNGTAEIEFETEQQARRSCNGLNGMHLLGGPIAVRLLDPLLMLPPPLLLPPPLMLPPPPVITSGGSVAGLARPSPTLPPGFEALPPPPPVAGLGAAAEARAPRSSGRRHSDRGRGPESRISKNEKRKLQRAKAKA